MHAGHSNYFIKINRPEEEQDSEVATSKQAGTGRIEGT